MTTGFTWAFNYAPFNFSTKNPKPQCVSQLYIRQALQEAVDQTAIINKVDKGYGVPIDSPLPPEHAPVGERTRVRARAGPEPLPL